MTTPQNSLRQQQEHGSGQHTPTGVRLNIRRSSEDQLVEISPAFRLLQKSRLEQPTSGQWREFSRRLTDALDKEAQTKSRFRSIQVIRDKFTSTDSVMLRVFGYALLAIALGAIAAGIWLLTSFMFGQPAASTAAAVHTSSPAVVAAAALPAAAAFYKA